MFGLAPQQLATYVDETFKHLAAFSDAKSGNMSLWPAFIAAPKPTAKKIRTMPQRLDGLRWLLRLGKQNFGEAGH